MAAQSTTPGKVFLIRHGEKLGDAGSDKDGGPNLSLQGSARAAAIPTLFAPASSEFDCTIKADTSSFKASYGTQALTGAAPRFDTPDFIFATADSSHSSRPRETATPVAMALGVPFDDTTYSDKSHDVKKLATDLTGDAKYSGKVILICWHHGTIPDLAQALGVANPPPWDGSTVFDRAWVIDFASTPLTVSDQPQMLLYGDSAT
jgi:phosphohistidine phosphatase SixA